MSEQKQTPATTKTQLPATVQEKERLPLASFKQGTLKATEKVAMQRATAEVGFSFEAAQRFGRNEELCLEKIEALCEDVYFASTAMYKVPRGGGTVEGLGIHAAVAIAQIWGHLKVNYVEHGTYDTEAQYEALVWDMVSNNWYGAPFTISLLKEDGTKKPPLNFQDEVKARASKEKRNAIWNAIPYYIRKQIIKAVKQTLYNEVGSDHMKRFDFYVKEFAKAGVNESMLLRYVNVPMRTKLEVDDVVDLKILYSRWKEEGMNVVTEAFPERSKKDAAQAESKQATASGDKKVATSKPGNPKTEEKSEAKTEVPKPSESPSGAENNAPASTAATGQESKEEAQSQGESQPEESQTPADADATTQTEGDPDLF